jgi:ribosome modulation factor
VLVESNYSPRDRLEYFQGRRACVLGYGRDKCPYESGHGAVTGFSISRHAWMAGHMEEEYSHRSYSQKSSL